MAAVPVTIQCMVYPRDKSGPPYPATLVGFASITGLQVGGGPILPPSEVPPVDPPLIIWGGPIDPYPSHPIYYPDPPTKPEEPPPEGWRWVYSPVYGWVAKPPGGGGKPQPLPPGE